MPSSLYTLWIDLETTGNSPDSDIIEVGAVLTDVSGREVLGEFTAVAQPSVFELRQIYNVPKVLDMHTKNGLLGELENTVNPSIVTVDKQMNDWLNNLYPSNQHLPLGGSGVSHFDRQYIKRQMPSIDKRLTYWSYDVGVLRRTWELMGLEPMPFEEDDKTHRALDDIKLHIEEWKYYTGQLAILKAQLEYERARA